MAAPNRPSRRCKDDASPEDASSQQSQGADPIRMTTRASTKQSTGPTSLTIRLPNPDLSDRDRDTPTSSGNGGEALSEHGDRPAKRRKLSGDTDADAGTPTRSDKSDRSDGMPDDIAVSQSQGSIRRLRGGAAAAAAEDSEAAKSIDGLDDDVADLADASFGGGGIDESKTQQRVRRRPKGWHLRRENRHLLQSARVSASPAAAKRADGNSLSPSRQALAASRRMPGRRRAPHPDDDIETDLRRQLELKVAYRALVKALKPVLAELALRTEKELKADRELYKNTEEYHDVQRELDARLEQRLAILDARFAEEQGRLQRMQIAYENTIQKGWETTLDDLRDTWLAHTKQMLVDQVDEMRWDADSEATFEEGEPAPASPRPQPTKGAARVVADKAAEQAQHSRSWPLVHPESAMDDTTARLGWSLLQKAAEDSQYERRPRNWAVYDGELRRESLAILNALTLSDATEAIELGKYTSAKPLPNEDATGLQALAQAIDLQLQAPQVQTAPAAVAKVESPIDAHERFVQQQQAPAPFRPAESTHPEVAYSQPHYAPHGPPPPATLTHQRSSSPRSQYYNFNVSHPPPSMPPQPSPADFEAHRHPQHPLHAPGWEMPRPMHEDARHGARRDSAVSPPGGPVGGPSPGGPPTHGPVGSAPIGPPSGYPAPDSRFQYPPPPTMHSALPHPESHPPYHPGYYPPPSMPEPHTPRHVYHPIQPYRSEHERARGPEQARPYMSEYSAPGRALEWPRPPIARHDAPYGPHRSHGSPPDRRVTIAPANPPPWRFAAPPEDANRPVSSSGKGRRGRPPPRAIYSANMPPGLDPSKPQGWRPFTNTMGPPTSTPHYVRHTDFRRKNNKLGKAGDKHGVAEAGQQREKRASDAAVPSGSSSRDEARSDGMAVKFEANTHSENESKLVSETERQLVQTEQRSDSATHETQGSETHDADNTTTKHNDALVAPQRSQSVHEAATSTSTNTSRSDDPSSVRGLAGQHIGHQLLPSTLDPMRQPFTHEPGSHTHTLAHAHAPHPLHPPPPPRHYSYDGYEPPREAPGFEAHRSGMQGFPALAPRALDTRASLDISGSRRDSLLATPAPLSAPPPPLAASAWPGFEHQPAPPPQQASSSSIKYAGSAAATFDARRGYVAGPATDPGRRSSASAGSRSVSAAASLDRGERERERHRSDDIDSAPAIRFGTYGASPPQSASSASPGGHSHAHAVYGPLSRRTSVSAVGPATASASAPATSVTKPARRMSVASNEERDGADRHALNKSTIGPAAAMSVAALSGQQDNNALSGQPGNTAPHSDLPSATTQQDSAPSEQPQPQQPPPPPQQSETESEAKTSDNNATKSEDNDPDTTTEVMESITVARPPSPVLAPASAPSDNQAQSPRNRNV